MTSKLIVEHQDQVSTITFNNPEQLNAMCKAMAKEFRLVMRDLKKNKKSHVVILTGAGRAFSAGGNLAMLEEKTKQTVAQNTKELRWFYESFLAVRDIPQPVIAKINGHAVGAGFCMSLACDFRLAASSAKMGANFVKLGLAPGMGGTWLINQLAGPVHAREILMLGDLFSADQALQYGLLNKVVPAESLNKTVDDLAQKLCSGGPYALSLIKKGLQEASDKNLKQMFAYDSKSQALCFKTKDLAEGLKAAQEKRSPVFKNH